MAGPGSIWNIFKNMGYTTLFGLENCDHFFSKTIGQKLEVDHTIRSFYCAAQEFLGFRTAKDAVLKQRCIGDHMSHYYILNYTLAYSNLYKDLNQWIYLHINTAHEATGLHANTLDLDLVDFLKQYLNTFKDSHDVAIFLQADHGMRYGNWYKDYEAYMESKLPSFFLIANNELLNSIENSYDSLEHNSKVLTTKPDLRTAALYLAGLPYGIEYDVHEDPRYSAFFNLFKEKVPKTRTCESSEIPSEFCSCKKMVEVTESMLEADQELQRLVETIAEITVYKMNSEVHTPKNMQAGIFCQKLSFKKVKRVFATRVTDFIEQFYVTFKVDQSPEAEFEVIANVGTDLHNQLLKVSESKGGAFPYVYRSFPVRIKTLGINRKDPYAGPCETLTRPHSIHSPYCICHSIDNIKEKYPSLIN